MSPISFAKMGDRNARTKRAQPEHVEQSLLFQWIELASGSTPVLALAYAIPNGGHRNIITATKLKREGVKAGVPDICLPVARGSFHSLYIEMKAGKKARVSETQSVWHSKLAAQGHAVRVAYGWEAGRDAILTYLSL